MSKFVEAFDPNYPMKRPAFNMIWIRQTRLAKDCSARMKVVEATAIVLG